MVTCTLSGEMGSQMRNKLGSFDTKTPPAVIESEHAGAASFLVNLSLPRLLLWTVQQVSHYSNYLPAFRDPDCSLSSQRDLPRRNSPLQNCSRRTSVWWRAECFDKFYFLGRPHGQPGILAVRLASTTTW